MSKQTSAVIITNLAQLPPDESYRYDLESYRFGRWRLEERRRGRRRVYSYESSSDNKGGDARKNMLVEWSGRDVCNK